MYGAFVGNLHHLRFLFGIKRPRQFDLTFDAVDHPLFGLAFSAILGIDLHVAEPDGDGFERPALAAGVELEGHRGARAQPPHARTVPCTAPTRSPHLPRLTP